MALLDYLEQYADLELEKIRNAETLAGLALNQHRLTAQIDDIIRRVGHVSNLDGEMAALSAKIDQTPWYQLFAKNNLKNQRNQVQQLRMQAANELKSLHGANPEGAIDVASKLNRQIERSRIFADKIVKPQQLEARQKSVEKTFSEKCLTTPGGEKIGLSRDFLKNRNLTQAEKAALMAAEKKFQTTAAVTWKYQGKSSPAMNSFKEKSGQFQERVSNIFKDIRQHPFFQKRVGQQLGKPNGKRIGEQPSQQKPSLSLYKDENGRLQIRREHNRLESTRDARNEGKGDAAMPTQQEYEKRIKQLEEELRRLKGQKAETPTAPAGGDGGEKARLAAREKQLQEREKRLETKETDIDRRNQEMVNKQMSQAARNQQQQTAQPPLKSASSQQNTQTSVTAKPQNQGAVGNQTTPAVKTPQQAQPNQAPTNSPQGAKQGSGRGDVYRGSKVSTPSQPARSDVHRGSQAKTSSQPARSDVYRTPQPAGGSKTATQKSNSAGKSSSGGKGQYSGGGGGRSRSR